MNVPGRIEYCNATPIRPVARYTEKNHHCLSEGHQVGTFSKPLWEKPLDQDVPDENHKDSARQAWGESPTFVELIDSMSQVLDQYRTRSSHCVIYRKYNLPHKVPGMNLQWCYD